MKSNKKRNLFIILCLLPAVLLFLIFMVYPTINVFYISLFKWGGFSPDKTFVGFNNFKTLFSDMKFIRSFQNTILIITLVTVITFTVAIFFAAILTREKIKGKNFLRVIFYIPNILSVVVIASIFSAIYDPKNGLLNSILALFRGDKDPIYWLGDQKIVIYSLLAAMVWQAVGYYMVMYIASMSSIPEALYEAADLEGTSKIKQFFSITLPLVWTNVRTTLTFFIISSINMNFLFVRALTDGKPDGSTESFLSYLYKQAYTNSSYGYGMAIGVVVFIFSFALSAIVNKATKREPLEF